MTAAAPASKPKIDWEGVEIAYRAGMRSLKDIGAEFGVSDAGIIKRAKRDGWSRDLAAKIAARAEAKVSAAAVSAEVSAANRVRDVQIIEANADVQANAIISQRDDVKRARKIVQALFDKLGLLIEKDSEVAKVIEMLDDPETGTDMLAEQMRKLAALPSQTDVARKLVDALRVAIELERKVLRIKDDQGADEFVRKIGEGVALSASEAYKRMLE